MVWVEFCRRGTLGHRLWNSWNFSFKVTEKGTRISPQSLRLTWTAPNVCQGCALLVYSRVLWKILIIVRQFSPITILSVSHLIDIVVTYYFHPIDTSIWPTIIAFSHVVVQWILISLIYSVFIMKLPKFHLLSDWKELSTTAGKSNICRIYWQWVEQTFLYTKVYRTFLYNPTKLKVPTKAPWMMQRTFKVRFHSMIYGI